jgi:23S rRNA (uridine2552-2'-O)-methyltransferase
MSRKSAKGGSPWMQEHLRDPYVQQAQEQGLRSRAAFKLRQIADRDRIFTQVSRVVDLGASPGGWSQLARDQIGPKGRVVAVDILPMAPLSGVRFVQGDFREAQTLDALLEALADDRADLVLSDMAPNISGTRSVDQPRAMYLAELAADLAERILTPGGSLLVKVFQGEGFETFVADLRRHYKRVAVRKPAASRARSREVYLLAQGHDV